MRLTSSTGVTVVAVDGRGLRQDLGLGELAGQLLDRRLIIGEARTAF